MLMGSLEVLSEAYTLAQKSGIGANNVHNLMKGMYLLRYNLSSP